jgi:hypothetical protein
MPDRSGCKGELLNWLLEPAFSLNSAVKEERWLNCSALNCKPVVPRQYSQSQSPGSPIWDFIKDDSFVLISCLSGSNNLNEQIYSFIGSVGSRPKSSSNSFRFSSLTHSVHEFHKFTAKNPGLLYLNHFISIISSLWIPPPGSIPAPPQLKANYVSP